MKYINIGLLFILFYGCGTHGKIKSYSFEMSNNDLIKIVDSILLSNPEYASEVAKTSGWIYFKLPTIGDQFKIRIGGRSEVTLISAGEKGKTTRLEKNLGFFEKKRLIKSFEKNFISKIKGLNTRSLRILREPFSLTSNIHMDTTIWPHYVIEYDTLVKYELPEDIVNLGIDYFSDLIIDFSNYSKKDIFINQYYRAFRIDDHYTGIVKDNLFLITGYHRVIGEKRKFEPIFGQKIWKEYLSSVSSELRVKHYKEIRDTRKERGHKETEVFRSFSKEFWMNGLDSLILYDGFNEKVVQ